MKRRTKLCIDGFRIILNTTMLAVTFVRIQFCKAWFYLYYHRSATFSAIVGKPGNTYNCNRHYSHVDFDFHSYTHNLYFDMIGLKHGNA